MTDQYFKHTPKALSNINQVENLAIEVEAAFIEVEKDLWSSSVNSASIGSSIGELDTWYLKQYNPNNGIINNYYQELYFPQYSKEASLDLIPSIVIADLNTAAIQNKLDPSLTYTYKHDGILVNPTDFCFINRKIVLGQSPTDGRALSLTYKGYEPVDNQDVGLDLKYNILQTTVNGNIVKSFTNTKSGNVYTISGYDFKNMCSRHVINIINNEPYNLDKYVTITDVDGETTFNISNISITNSSISFESEDNVPQVVKIYIANSNIGKLLEGIYRLFYFHNHGDDGGKLVNHSDLTGLFNNTTDIKYRVTGKENYDHPQYLNREGYIEAPEVYNNAMLGDLLIGSTNPSNFYNNLTDNSFKIVFGEYASGHRISYSNDTDSLIIDSLSRDGVKLVSPKNKNILELNNHIITDLVDGDYSGLRLSVVPSDISGKEVAVFSIKKAVDTGSEVIHEDEAELQVYSSVFSITKIKDELNLLDNAILSFGSSDRVRLTTNSNNITLSDNTTNKNQSFVITLPITAASLTVDHVDAKSIHITDNQSLVFGSSTTHDGNNTDTLKHNSTSNQVELSLTKPVRIKNNGYESGVDYSANTRLFASNSQGMNTTNSAEVLDLYLQSSGDIYAIKKDFTYSAGSTNLKSVNRANIYAGDISSNNLNINYDLDSIRALKLNGDTHRVFVQKDLQGNTAIQLQSPSGVNVISGYSINGSTVNLTYGTVRASEFRIEGGGDTAGFYGNVIIPTGSTLTVNGAANLNSALTLNNNLTVTGTSTLTNLVTSGINTGTVVATNSVSTPLLIAPAGSNNKIVIGSDVEFNNTTTFKQSATFTTNCVFNTVDSTSITTTNLTVTNNVTLNNIAAANLTLSGALQFKSMLQTDSNITSEFAGSLLLKKGLILDRNTTIRLGSADITSTRNTSGVLISETEIKLGNNSVVRSNKVSVNKGIPTATNNNTLGGYSFETNSGAVDGDTGLFCTDKGSASVSEDLVFFIDGIKQGEISSTPLDLAGNIDGREKTLVTAEMVKDQTDSLLFTILDKVYPIGTVYENADDNRNPKEVLNWPNSVWQRFAVGMTRVGAEGSIAAEKMPASWNKPSNKQLILGTEFGEWQHALTEDENGEHDHEFPGDDHLTAFGITKIREQRVYDAHSDLTGGFASGWYNTSESGKGTPHENTQPSIVTAVWKRVG